MYTKFMCRIGTASITTRRTLPAMMFGDSDGSTVVTTTTSGYSSMTERPAWRSGGRTKPLNSPSNNSRRDGGK